MPQQMGPMMGPNGPMMQMPQYMQPHAMQGVERPLAPVVMDLPNDKDQLGERLYPLVESKNPANASKITGMLLEMEIEQIHNILRDPNQLDKWISEAMKVLFSV